MSIIGIPIGFYGYLFPGNINIMVLELYNSKKIKLLFLILGLILAFESIYCILSLTIINTLKIGSPVYSYVEYFSYALVFIMGIWMLLERRNNKKASQQNTLFRGVFSIIIHPQQIPFWVVAGILITRIAHITLNSRTLAEFVLFNAVGTLLAMIAYMFFGRKILGYFNLNISHINKFMGAVYILLVLIHFF
jgi:hypothetical protein